MTVSLPYNSRRSRAGLLVIWVFFAVLAAGCVSIPARLVNEEARPGIEKTVLRESVCGETLPISGRDSTGQSETGLDSSGFRLLNWNIFKGKKKGWQEDLQRFARESDILILQEGYLADDLRGLLNRNQLHWAVAAAFEHKDITSGVLTASRVEPDFSCSFWRSEPLIRVPKTAMITIYPLSGYDENLLVANIHMINFTIGSKAFRSQLDTLGGLLAQHRGPIIIAGDFNTWSDKRCEIVDDFFTGLDLAEVTFTEDKRTCLLGEEVDRVYYRGLEVTDADSLQVKSSDHNPVQVSFKLVENRSGFQ